MWFMGPMNPDEPILEHLGITGEEYREKCREDLRQVIVRPIVQELGTFQKTTYIPPDVEREAMIRTAIKKFYDEHPDRKTILVSFDAEIPDIDELCRRYQIPRSFLTGVHVVGDAEWQKIYDIFNRMYIEPMQVQLSEQLQVERDRLAPEIQSTDEEEIIWPI